MNSDQNNMSRPPSFVDPTTARGYELTGKIMMSAIIIVFAIVVVMVLLHIYSRWYIIRNHRRGRRRTQLIFYVEPNSASGVESRGLDTALLKSLPTFVFSSSADDENEHALECAVCLSEFEDGEKGRLLPKCNHRFHVDCIDMWFHSHSTCPLCRATVDGESPFSMKGIDEDLPVEIVVELSESNRGESTHPESGSTSGLCTECNPGPSSSFGARRKGLDLVGVSVEIPTRTASFSFPNSEDLALSSPAGQGFKSPTSRLLSFRRKLSREKKPIPSPSSSSGIGTSCAEWADIEDGRIETRSSWSRATTPR